jgi:CxxC-x17-CxxC domain-containing protein
VPMSYADKQVTCHDCGNVFTFSTKEQEEFASLGRFNVPKRCVSCRAKRKPTTFKNDSLPNVMARNIDNGSAPRRLFAAKCSTCGKDTQVPFEPHPDRPVYCYDCLRKVKQAVRT